ncbi:SDR family oxidoreductase [Roseibium sp. HPY-6]|uniref:SDR family oxidoreductase n=1 Tax=Roseibium sp. HPY-6 TaxID=3229852 RepID=UPI00338FE8C6
MPTCLITATNRGIGFELARAALSDGWKVFGSVRSQDAARKSLEQLGEGYTPLVFDVTDRVTMAAVAQEMTDRLDLLINNAGVLSRERQSPLDMDFEVFLKTLEINTLAPLAVSQTFLPHLRKSDSAKILTISSQMSWMGYRKSDALSYRVSKAAVNKVMQGLSTELEPEGIPVALIDPGWVRTDMGGPGADNDAAVVAKGILNVASSLQLTDTGKFFKWSGEERPF